MKKMLIICLGASLLLPGPLYGLVPLGPEFLVNTFTKKDQEDPSVAMDKNGHFVIVWESGFFAAQDGSASGVFAKRFDAHGTEIAPPPDVQGLGIGNEFQVNTYRVGRQEDPSVAMDALGNFVIAWTSRDQDGSDDGIFAQRFDSNGNRVGAEFQVNTYTTDFQFSPAAAMDSNGNFIIVWESNGQDGNLSGIFAKRYNADGLELPPPPGVQLAGVGNEFQVNTVSTSFQRYPAVAMNADGHFVITWTDSITGTNKILAQRFNNEGKRVNPQFLVNTTVSFGETPSVGMFPNRAFVVAWTTIVTISSLSAIVPQWAVYAQRFDGHGNQVGPAFLVDFVTWRAWPVVATNPHDRFVIAWHSDDGSLDGVFGKGYDNSDIVHLQETSVFQANIYTGGAQHSPAIALAPNEDFVVAWQSYDQAPDNSGFGVFSRRFNLFQPKIVLLNDSTGGDCDQIGEWDDSVDTCKPEVDLNASVEIGDDDLTLDCNGHAIIGNGTGDGILIGAGRTGVTVKNCVVKHFNQGIVLGFNEGNTLTGNTVTQNGNGILLQDSNHNRLDTITAKDNMFYGIVMSRSTHNTITNSYLAGHSQGSLRVINDADLNIFTDNIAEANRFGMELIFADDNTLTGNTFINNDESALFLASAFHNIIYDNLFHNPGEVSFSGSSDPSINRWDSVTLIPGANIIGGSAVGGNFWGRPDGSGFSETCADTSVNGFGICDSAFILDADNVDAFPLTGTPPCGDGAGQSSEACDDGNTVSGDGCSALCRIEDADGDGVFNHLDLCSTTPAGAAVDTNGCADADVDFDADGICNFSALSGGLSGCTGADNCPGTPNPGQQDADANGIGDLCEDCVDTDGDGVCDVGDNCPQVTNADQADADTDGQGDVCDICPNDSANDADADGVCGDIDACPDSPAGTTVDSRGCTGAQNLPGQGEGTNNQGTNQAPGLLDNPGLAHAPGPPPTKPHFKK